MIAPFSRNYFQEEEITEDFCGSSINSPIGGEIPIMSKSIVTSVGEVFSAVAVTVVGDTTVAFLGTKGGEIKKVLYRSS